VVIIVANRFTNLIYCERGFLIFHYGNLCYHVAMIFGTYKPNSNNSITASVARQSTIRSLRSHLNGDLVDRIWYIDLEEWRPWNDTKYCLTGESLSRTLQLGLGNNWAYKRNIVAHKIYRNTHKIERRNNDVVLPHSAAKRESKRTWWRVALKNNTINIYTISCTLPRRRKRGDQYCSRLL
jgi:hypothetical protein